MTFRRVWTIKGISVRFNSNTVSVSYFTLLWWSVNVNILLTNMIDSLFIHSCHLGGWFKIITGRSTFKTYTYDWHIDPAALGSVSVIGAVFIADSWNPMANQAKLTIAPNQMKKKWSDTRIFILNRLFFMWNFIVLL